MGFIKVENLSIDLGEFHLVDIDFEIKKGDYLTIIGPTGSGKSILLETIAGFYKPKKGRVFLEGEDITNLPPEKRNMSIVYQDYVLFPTKTVFENIAYGLKKKINDKEEIKKEVTQIAEILNIAHLLHRKPDTLSGGEQQRVALARALVVKPKLLLMDEPFSALDVKTRENLRNLVKKAIEKYETTILHVTHDFDDVWNLATKILVMRNGKILQKGDINDIFYRPSINFVADFVGTNVLEGEIIGKEDGLSKIKVGDCILLSIDDSENNNNYNKSNKDNNIDKNNNVKLSIRPEDIIISKNPINISARNEFKCKVKEIKKIGNLVYLILNIGGTPTKCILTPNALSQLEIKEGDEVYAIIKAINVRIIN
ncbi:ATP-binding cassette domain-containing protein [Methanothermococcus okinawensis]|uniref:Molybdate/tungstate import ATP-binding protein WtpC n=1 Tax=Methanothermococcus okinawensis (strain DSM 14208 / JCM 11175 / IH1) TaxID=647113 RepID=F8AJV7_METOI|nr:ATP-binding cassette domain-containing protein [Methanothermococcus okinawensis]AEH07309.1 Fe(3+)-transporting ATPase [Methanothermococcus okinawensis IH1]